MMMAVHQFGLLGGQDYDSKETRLEQLLDRIPANSGTTLIRVKQREKAAVTAILDRCSRKAADAAQNRTRTGTVGISYEMPELETWSCGACTFVNEAASTFCKVCEMSRTPLPRVVVTEIDSDAMLKSVEANTCNIIINYDFPASGRDYIRRLSSLLDTEPRAPAPPRVAYTFVQEDEIRSRHVHEVVKLLKYTRKCANTAKAAEFDSAIGLLELGEGEDEEDDEGEDDDDDETCCVHCCGNTMGTVSHHPLLSDRGIDTSVCSGVEVVRIPLKALADLDKVAPFIAPRVLDHTCTVICLHCLYCHTPWDGFEQFFAPPELTGTMRVVLVLAEDVSWHEYPDCALLCAGGSSWIDILDMSSMDRTDALIEQLVDHEIALLDGKSERVVLMGMSQGGGQSMLRFLRSKRRLGGWIGSVCHVPTAPHAPRNRDPLLELGRPLVNIDRPIRLLAAESDNVFPAGLVQRDVARLRDVGGFTDVQIEVRSGMGHSGVNEDYVPRSSSVNDAIRSAPRPLGRGAAKSINAAMRRAEKSVPDLLFLQEVLPSIVDFTSSSVPESC
jgi:dienelactone hydrolase